MLRPALILAFLASLASLGVAYFVTKPQVELINSTLVDTRDSLKKSQDAEKASSALAKKIKAEKEIVDRDLAETKVSLEASTTKATEQETRANKLTVDLAKTTSERNDARNELAQWQALGVKPVEVTALKIGKKAAEEDRDNLAAEKVVFLRKIQTLQAHLDQYVNPDKEVVLPTGLAGHVVAVDPKWNFVLLDIGADAGVLERGQMKVHRQGKFISKVRIVSVEAKTAIANVMTDWQQVDQNVATGDSVLF